MKAFLTSALFLLASLCASAASFSVTSPDNSLVLNGLGQRLQAQARPQGNGKQCGAGRIVP